MSDDRLTEQRPPAPLPGAMVTDPVCGMRIDPDDAAATAEHEGQTYYFCSQVCHDAFTADPTPFVG
jgi:P-type Cu+ transporter